MFEYRVEGVDVLTNKLVCVCFHSEGTVAISRQHPAEETRKRLRYERTAEYARRNEPNAQDLADRLAAWFDVRITSPVPLTMKKGTGPNGIITFTFSGRDASLTNDEMIRVVTPDSVMVRVLPVSPPKDQEPPRPADAYARLRRQFWNTFQDMAR